MTTIIIILLTALTALTALYLSHVLHHYITKRIKNKKNNICGHIKHDEFETERDSSGSVSPIQIVVTNNSAKSEMVTLFGKNRTEHKENNGNSENISIKSYHHNKDYTQLLNQISDSNIKSNLLRIQSTNTFQITRIMSLSSSDANGALVQVPLITQAYFSANQFQSGIVDIPYVVVIDNNFEISVEVLANTTFVLTVFPSKRNCDETSFLSIIGKIVSDYNYKISKIEPSMYFPSVPVAAMPFYVNGKGFFTNKNKLKTVWNKFLGLFKKKK